LARYDPRDAAHDTYLGSRPKRIRVQPRLLSRTRRRRSLNSASHFPADNCGDYDSRNAQGESREGYVLLLGEGYIETGPAAAFGAKQHRALSTREVRL
jgi:hypothetical protein